MIQDHPIQDDTIQDDTSLASFTIPRPPAAARQAPYSKQATSAPSADAASRARRRGEGGRTGRQDSAADAEVFHIRLADSSCHQQAAGLLIRKMYSWRGYAVDGDGAADGAGPASAASATKRITLFAECRGAVVGTMGLCLDGALGLPADENFRDQLDTLRTRGRRLAEPSRLAIDAGMTKRVFASMIHVSYLYAHVLHGFSDYVIEVNPRHVVFYQRMLGFELAGPSRPCSRVGAPAVLLRLPLVHMGAQIAACGGRPELQSDERSFYPWFFAPADETGIIARLLSAQRQE